MTPDEIERLATVIREHYATGRHGMSDHACATAIAMEYGSEWSAIVDVATVAAYRRGHWDGLRCDSRAGFSGRLDECDHVGFIVDPNVDPLRAAQARDTGCTHLDVSGNEAHLPGCPAALSGESGEPKEAT